MQFIGTISPKERSDDRADSGVLYFQGGIRLHRSHRTGKYAYQMIDEILNL